jgi:hypothetical protein
MDPDGIKVTRRMLEALPVHSVKQAAALHNLRLTESRAMDAEVLVRQLSAFVWMEKLQDEEVELKVSTPATWWQALKQEVIYPALMLCKIGKWHPFLRLTMKHLLPRWPVRMRQVNTSHQFKTVAKLPEFNYESPRGCGKFVLETMVSKTSDSRWDT